MSLKSWLSGIFSSRAPDVQSSSIYPRKRFSDRKQHSSPTERKHLKAERNVSMHSTSSTQDFHSYGSGSSPNDDLLEMAHSLIERFEPRSLPDAEDMLQSLGQTDYEHDFTYEFKTDFDHPKIDLMELISALKHVKNMPAKNVSYQSSTSDDGYQSHSITIQWNGPLSLTDEIRAKLRDKLEKIGIKPVH